MIWMYFQKGGWVMYPLLVFSVVALGLAFERLLFYIRLKVDIHQWFEGVEQMPQDQVAGLASRFPQLKRHPIKSVFSALWKHREMDRSDLEALAQEESEEQLQYLERNLKPLSVIAILSPLTGLLGTVLGIMKAFMKTSDAASIDPTLLAGGIWEALITTFVGLAIAIPVWVFYYYFTSKVDRQVFLMEFFSSRFIRWMHQRGLLGND